MAHPESPLLIRLADDRRKHIVQALQSYFADELDEDLSDFRAQNLLDLILAQVGPAVYNQGVRDACAHIQEKLVDLEGEVYEPEPPPR